MVDAANSQLPDYQRCLTDHARAAHARLRVPNDPWPDDALTVVSDALPSDRRQALLRKGGALPEAQVYARVLGPAR